MAVRYSLADAFEVILKNQDQEAIDDIFRRYSGPAQKILRAICSTSDVKSLADLMALIPDYVTMQKINKLHKDALDDVEDDEDEELDVKELDTTKRKTTKTTSPAKAAKAAPKVVEDDDDEDEETNDYEGKNARELFEICKKRGIDVQPRKRATTYKKLLEEWDAKHADTVDDDDDDDWDI